MQSGWRSGPPRRGGRPMRYEGWRWSASRWLLRSERSFESNGAQLPRSVPVLKLSARRALEIVPLLRKLFVDATELAVGVHQQPVALRASENRWRRWRSCGPLAEVRTRHSTLRPFHRVSVAGVNQLRQHTAAAADRRAARFARSQKLGDLRAKGFR